MWKKNMENCWIKRRMSWFEFYENDESRVKSGRGLSVILGKDLKIYISEQLEYSDQAEGR